MAGSTGSAASMARAGEQRRGYSTTSCTRSSMASSAGSTTSMVRAGGRPPSPPRPCGRLFSAPPGSAADEHAGSELLLHPDDGGRPVARRRGAPRCSISRPSPRSAPSPTSLPPPFLSGWRPGSRGRPDASCERGNESFQDHL